jgi:hypothetical protein
VIECPARFCKFLQRAMIGNTARNLILGLISGMTQEQVSPFFLSLEKAGYRGDICLFVQGLAPETLAFLHARRVNLVPFQKNYLNPKWARFASLAWPFLKPRQRRRMEEQLALTYLHAHCARNVYCRSYLAECGRFYEHVMLTDVRDVLFQNDPFAFEIPDGLSVFMEDPGLILGTCPWDSQWIRHAFGAAVLKELSDKPIFCSGTIFGTPAALLDHLDQVLRLYYARKTHFSMDQASHNYVIYKQPAKQLHCFDNDAGPVLAMAHMDARQFHFNAQGLLVNSQGRVFNTLHQYDRHPELARQLLCTLT